MLHCNQVCISSHFRDNWPQTLCAHTETLTHRQTHAASDFIFCPMQCIAMDRQKLLKFVFYELCIILAIVFLYCFVLHCIFIVTIQPFGCNITMNFCHKTFQFLWCPNISCLRSVVNTVLDNACAVHVLKVAWLTMNKAKWKNVLQSQLPSWDYQVGTAATQLPTQVLN